MAKSKTRKGRRSGPARSLSQVAAARAGKNFAKMVVEKIPEGSHHILTLQTAEGEVSTEVTYDGKTVSVADPTMTEHLMVTLASMQTTAITVKTFESDVEEGEDPLVFLRCWLVDGGVFVPATAEEARDAAEDSGEAAGIVFRDGFKLS